MQTKRTPLVAGNWKMNGLKKDIRLLGGGLAQKMDRLKNPSFEMLIFPPFPLLGLAVEKMKSTGIKIGAQDCHTCLEGAHTGEVSAALLKNIGCAYVIVGHSERRINQGEGNKQIKAKAEAALSVGLKIILCVGETLKERKSGMAFKINRQQLRDCLPDNASAANTVIAYEPVWAIGTGQVATPQQAQEVHRALRKVLNSRLGSIESEKMRLLYGGSMKPSNAKELLALPDIDGGLIGGSSLSVSQFWAIAQAA